MYFKSSTKKASDKLQLFKLKHSRLDTVSHGVESEKYTYSFQKNFGNRILGCEKLIILKSIATEFWAV